MIPFRQRRATRRLFCHAGLTLFLVAGCSAISGQSAGAGGAAAAPTTGDLLLARNGKFFLFDLATHKQTPFGQFPKGSFVAAPSVSADRKQLVYTMYLMPTVRNDLGGNDLAVASATGANPRVIRTHSQQHGSFENPTWAADQKTILATVRASSSGVGQPVQESTTIFRVPLDGGEPVSLVAGDSPTASPDGKYLAYLTTDKEAKQRFWIANADGSHSRELAANQGFSYLRAPCFSPDSQLILFAGAGGPKSTKPTAKTSPGLLASFFGPAVAEADGIPMNIWTIRPDGSQLRQLSNAEDHSPTPTWSPDGKWIASAGEMKLLLIDAAGTQSVSLASNILLSGVAWLS